MAPADSKSPQPLLGNVLVTGGCGFFGFYLVRHLLDDRECGEVFVLDRIINKANVHAGATYVEGSITDAEAVRSVIRRARPRVIFHAASPNVSFPTHGRSRDFHDTNIRGTETLIAASRAAAAADAAADGQGMVQALVYTSTVDIYARPPHVDVDETHPRWPMSATMAADEYDRTKAEADRIVRAANAPAAGFGTVSMVLSHMYGVRCSQVARVALDTFGEAGMIPFVQIGEGRNVVEVVSADNAAAAHLLAAKALLDPGRARGRVDGEAFNVSDGRPVLFWHHMRLMAETAGGGEGSLGRVLVVPAWLMVALVYLVEWLLLLFTLGLVRPPQQLGRTALSYSLHSHTYSTRKIRERLGFDPDSDHDAVVKESIRWEMARREELKGKGEAKDAKGAKGKVKGKE